MPSSYGDGVVLTVHAPRPPARQAVCDPHHHTVEKRCSFTVVTSCTQPLEGSERMAPTLREDIVTLTPDLVHEAVRRFTAAEGIFAVTEQQVAALPRRVFTHAAPTVLDILSSGRGHGGADFLVFADQRWTFDQFFADVDALAAVLQHDAGVKH